MTTHKILPNWALSTFPWKSAAPTLHGPDMHVEVDDHGGVDIEFWADYEGNQTKTIPRVALQALFDAHDQHVKSFGGYVKVVAPGSSKE